MNRHRAERLLNDIRSRVQMFYKSTGAQRGFRAEANNNGSPSSVYLYNTIGGFEGTSAKDVVDTLAELEGPLDLHINSGGGDIFEGVAIHNAFKNYPGKVTSYVDGVAASAASFVALAGEEVVVEKNATMMIHDGQGMVIGNEDDLREAADVLGMLSNTIAEMYAEKMGLEVEEVRTLMKAETWFTAQEAVDKKLADRINGDSPAPEEPTNKLDLSIFNYKSTPTTRKDNPPAFDVDGLRDALKGVFA